MFFFWNIIVVAALRIDTYNRNKKSAVVTMSSGKFIRRDFICKSLQGAAALVAISPFEKSYAANYFGDKEAYPEVVKPKDAIKNMELQKSSEVQGNLGKLNDYLSIVKELKADMVKDSQALINKKVRASLEVSKLRNVLNGVNVVFDEDTQRGTDRLIRDIIQDVFELENVTQLKSGATRSARKITVVNKRLEKLEKALTELLKFF